MLHHRLRAAAGVRDNGGGGGGIPGDYAAYWSFDDVSGSTINDESGNHPLANNGGVFQSGVIGDGIYFNGSSYAATATNTEFQFGRLDPFSIVFYLDLDATPASFMHFAGTRGGGTASGWRVATSGPGSREKIGVLLDAAPSLGGTIFIQTSANVLTSGLHKIAVTYSGSGTAAGFKIYVDGVDQSITVDSDDLTGNPTNTSKFSIGARASDLGGAFSGLLDELYIYNREISASEIAEF